MTSTDPLLEKSRNLLGWNLILEALTGHSASPATRTRLKTFQPENDYYSAKAALEETEEMTAVFESGISFPMQTFADLNPILEKAGQSGILEPKELLHVLKFLKLANTIHSFLNKRKESPRLKVLADRINSLTTLRKEYGRCLNDEGEILETATPELKQAVRSVRSAQEKLEMELGKLMSSPSVIEGLQDAYFTEREGRFVLPIKAEHKSKVEGIIHDTSGSGVTLFIEPCHHQ